MIKWSELSRSAREEAARRLLGAWEVELYARKSGAGHQLRYVQAGEPKPEGFQMVEHRHDDDFHEALNE